MAKNNEKKDSNLLIYLVIIILLILIILPPVFRTLFKDETKEESSPNPTSITNNSITSLSCRKRTTDNYSVVVGTIYKDNDISKITITYTNMAKSNNETQNNNTETNNNTTPTDNNTVNNTPTETPTDNTATAVVDNVAMEIEQLKAIEGVSLQESENVYKFVIDLKKIDMSFLTTVLSQRVQTLSLQKNYYETLGYTCSSMKS